MVQVNTLLKVQKEKNASSIYGQTIEKLFDYRAMQQIHEGLHLRIEKKTFSEMER